jgi:hypothetical protein
MSILFDVIYNWVVHFVPGWLSWVLMAPLFAFVALILTWHFWGT